MKTALTIFTVALVCALPLPAANGAIIYQSSGGTYALAFPDSGMTAVGDSAFTDSADQHVAGAVVPFHTVSDPNDPNDTFTAAYTPAFLRLTLYQNAGGLPGVVIESSTVPGPSFPEGGNSATGGTDVLFPFADAKVGNGFVFGIAELDASLKPVSGNSPSGFGVFLSTDPESPDVGSSAVTILYEAGGQWNEHDFGKERIQVDITFDSELPLPEPGTASLFLFAALALARRPNRRHRG